MRRNGVGGWTIDAEPTLRSDPDRCPAEREGDVGYVTFPCGYTIGADGDATSLYDGAAGTCVAMATGSVRHLSIGSIGMVRRRSSMGSTCP